MKKLYVIAVIGLMLLTTQCKQEEKNYSFKKAGLNSGAKELLDKYIKYSNLPKAINEISIYNYVSKDNKYVYVMNASRLLSLAVDNHIKEKNYCAYYKGFHVFIIPILKDQLFSENGIVKIPENKIETVNEDADDYIPYSDDIISSWEFEIKNSRLGNLAYQFCVLTEEQIQEIELITFN